MSVIPKNKRRLSTSSQSAKKQIRKTQETPRTPGESTKTLGHAEVLSSSSISPLAEVYKDADFRRDWTNDVRFHVAENLAHLRRYSGMSQAKLARAAGTSQSAIARIESGQENITLDTLERIIHGLDGRFYVSIHPEAYPLPHLRPWWEQVEFPQTGWTVVNMVGRRTNKCDQVLVGLERSHELASGNTLTGGMPILVAGSTSQTGGTK